MNRALRAHMRAIGELGTLLLGAVLCVVTAVVLGHLVMLGWYTFLNIDHPLEPLWPLSWATALKFIIGVLSTLCIFCLSVVYYASYAHHAASLEPKARGGKGRA